MRQSRKKPQERGFVRHTVVAEHVRREIATGRQAPGSKLPSHVELQRKLGTTPVTVQRALHQLREEGFIRTGVSALGTHVADHPPSHWRYALVLDDHPPKDDRQFWTRYHAALCQVARQVNKLGPRQIEVYFDVNSSVNFSEGYARLLNDMTHHRLAGLMFANYPHELKGSPILEQPGVCRVSAGHFVGAKMPGIRRQYWGTVTESLRWIVEQGRRSVGVITVPHFSQAQTQFLIDEAGLASQPFWMQAVAPHNTEWARHAVNAILRAHSSAIPEALMVTDDHLVEAVADALIEFGVRVPDDMLVIGHWNFPLEFTRDLPVQPIGQDNTKLLRGWVESIDAQRRGDKVPEVVDIGATLFGRDALAEPVEIQQLPAPTAR
jgi:DNA-binding LacI/PurR family transcriptional regulator